MVDNIHIHTQTHTRKTRSLFADDGDSAWSVTSSAECVTIEDAVGDEKHIYSVEEARGLAHIMQQAADHMEAEQDDG